jgi:hypothetical protein
MLLTIADLLLHGVPSLDEIMGPELQRRLGCPEHPEPCVA